MDIDTLPSADEVATIRPEALQERIARGNRVPILDVRTEGEYDKWVIESGNVDIVNVPYYEFLMGVDDELLDRVPSGDEELVVVCVKGGASAYVVSLLEDEGIEAVNLDGGMNSWARLYDAVPISRYEGMGTLIQYQRPSSGCLAYMLISDGEAAVVDPLRAFTHRYLDDAQQLGVELVYAIDTHIHADHVSGVRSIATCGAEAVIPEPAVARGVDYEIEYTTVADGDVLTVGDLSIAAIHTPGHTSGMTSFLVDESVLLTGDCLFLESVGSPDPEGGDSGTADAVRTLYETLQRRILDLSDDVLVAPGHFTDAVDHSPDGTYTASLGELRDRMPALEMNREAFVEFLLADTPPRPSNFEEIITLNLGRASADDDQAFELELGPNNCAASQQALTSD
ncbi:MBL fold metallo-hydrolase [Haloferax sp. MBLA0076]|uniref:MBL fold metallo-hydrolase n=1 Tax=Haloferax litoreum TaxID=2666140 RepID=A0A6A8GL08_9EURY|nr:MULTISPECIES: MBL fold metallo-hydrolase [Haloferax]KAB1190482.1 MBL fold metallo-hydrolase [Haloferax sp. CBA1148]MRX23461.1 MBL fold metallo-hydrolase [Haloferax litoreum]